MSQAQIIDGRTHADAVKQKVAAEVADLKARHGVQPGLAVVLVGDDPASQIYVRSKGQESLAAGFHSETHRLPGDTTQAELMALVRRLNDDPAIDGILVQMPLPGHLDEAAVMAVLDPDKDVDGFHVVNAGRLAIGLPGLSATTSWMVEQLGLAMMFFLV